MVIGFLLILGGLPQLAAGWLLPIPALTIVGGAWIVAGAANVALSGSARASGATQQARGAPVRGLIALACAAAAIGTGVAATGFVDDVAAWRVLPITAGAVIGFLSLLGFLGYASGSMARSAIHPATVVVRSYRSTGLNASSTSPTIRLSFDVYPQQLAPYQAEILSAVPILVIPKLAVGARFDARVAGPAKPKAIIVDWDAALQAPSGDGAGPATSPAVSAPAADPATRLREVEALRAQGLVTDEEYQAQRARILDSL